jgi:transcriptional regulator with XRE-family HTH domain
VAEKVPTDADFAFIAAFTKGVGKVGKLSRDALSDALLISRPTLSRWLSGKNLPHPSMREVILKHLNELAEEHK